MRVLGLSTLALAAASLVLSSCSDADIASANLSKAADNFEIARRFVFINGITNDYLLSVEGRCSLGNSDTAGRLSITCRTGQNEYKKHIVGISDNTTFVAEPLEPINVNTYHYRVEFKPQTIVPDINLRISTNPTGK